jgi:hypothetical protein
MNYNSNIAIDQYNVDLCDNITPVLSIAAWGNKYSKEVPQGLHLVFNSEV